MPPPAARSSSGARRKFFINQAVVFAVIFGLCATWVLMSEYIQGMQDGWAKPWFILYVIHTGYSLNLLIYYALYVRRTGDWCLRTHFGACCRRGPPAHGVATSPRQQQPYPVTQRQLVILSVVLSILSAFVGYSWYLSLNHTLASANNAIYQSASAFVFVLSYFLLGEAMTVQKAAAVVLAIGGVIIVITAPAASTQNSPVVQTVGGYLWVVASTVGYAVYEVVYSRYTRQRLHSWRDACIRGPALEAAFRGSGGTTHGGDRAPTAKAASAGGDAALDEGDAALAAADDSSALLLPLPHGGSSLSPSSVDGDRAFQTATAGSVVGGAGTGTGAALGLDAQPHAPHSEPDDAEDGGGSAALRAEQSSLVIGLMGVWSLLLLWPMFFVLNATGVEPFVWPDERRVRLLALNAGLDAVYNALVLFGIQVSTPLVISVGTILVVPATALTDYLMHGVVLGPQTAAGGVVIVASFLVLQLPWAAWVAAADVPRCCGGVVRGCKRHS